MAYDELLADRVRDLVQGEPGLTEKRMFGGLAFLLHGNMAVSASGQGGLMVRSDPADAETLTSRPYVSRVEMRGRDYEAAAVETAALDSDDGAATLGGRRPGLRAVAAAE